MATKIEIIRIADVQGGAQIRTPYRVKGGGTPLVVGDRSNAWKASRGAATALVDMAAEWYRRAKTPLVLVDAARDGSVQAHGRAKYEAWLAAGKPAENSSKFVPSAMKNVFVGKANESNHQWGGAVDLGVAEMCEGDDAKLSLLWDVADDFGFMPIISRPSLQIDECWHFDRLGPLAKVRDMFRARAATRHSSYVLTATVGCLLAGTYVGDRQMERLAQARLALAAALVEGGKSPGAPDGVLGRMTQESAASVGLTVEPGVSASTILNQLDERQLGHAELAAL